MAEGMQGAELTKLSFLQMLADKITKMDCDGSLYSRLLEGRTKVVESTMGEIKDMIKNIGTKMDTFHERFEKNILEVKTAAEKNINEVALANEKKNNETALIIERRNSVFDRWRMVMVILICVAIGISCIAMGMKIEEALLRGIGLIK